MTFVLRFVLVSLSCLAFTTCTPKNDEETIYNSLKEGQAKVVITIDGNSFYTDQSVFAGNVTVADNFFKMNLFDQFESNVIVSFNEPNWYVTHPIDRPIFANNAVQASIMIGKVTDKVNRYGAGYLMTEGTLSIRALSDEKLIVHIQGKVGKYEAMREPQKWNSVEGDIIYKKPRITLTDVKKSAIYF